jgi:ABC-type transporter Mla maintaining outer membrane lipid asymmetry ATPase subunit MlaF
MDLIVELHHEYKPTTFMVSHDLRRLLPAVERILALFDGEIVFDGTLRDLASSAPASVRGFVSCRFELPTVATESVSSLEDGAGSV